MKLNIDLARKLLRAVLDGKLSAAHIDGQIIHAGRFCNLFSVQVKRHILRRIYSQIADTAAQRNVVHKVHSVPFLRASQSRHQGGISGSCLRVSNPGDRRARNDTILIIRVRPRRAVGCAAVVGFHLIPVPGRGRSLIIAAPEIKLDVIARLCHGAEFAV